MADDDHSQVDSAYKDDNDDDDASSVQSSADSSNESTFSSLDKGPDDFAADDIRLHQMRRKARDRKARVQGVTRISTLQSYDDMLKAHAFQRMKDGMQTILSLHSPVELSSICGCLHLRVQEKAHTSIDAIMRFLTSEKQLNEEKVKTLMTFMWEGALWEYLHSIGHPVRSMKPDPKRTILELWASGGLLEGDGLSGFVPHFISREVKKRNDWIQSKDIQDRLEKLRVAQDAAKVAERSVISNHDYTNILKYFNQMGGLRRLEQAVREYLISELEIARSRVDSGEETAKLLRKQLSECEDYSARVANTLNEQLAQAEFLCDQHSAERMHYERDLQRLLLLSESYLAAEVDRQQPGGGSMRALKLRKAELSTPTVRALHSQLQRYRSLRDVMDSRHRGNTRMMQQQIEQLTGNSDELQQQLDDSSAFAARETERANRAERELFYTRRRLVRAENNHALLSQQSWQSSMRQASKYVQLQRVQQRCKPLLLAGLQHQQRTVHQLSRGLLQTLQLASQLEINSVFDQAAMRREDVRSALLRQQEQQRLASQGDAQAAAARAKAMKDGKSRRSSNRSNNNTPVNPRPNSRQKSRPSTGSSVATKRSKGSKSKGSAKGTTSAKAGSSSGGSSKKNKATAGTAAAAASSAKKKKAK